MAEAAAAVGAISIAGCASSFQLPYFAAACDYTLIGEELLAVGAFISEEPERTGAIASQDYVKVAVTVLILLGSLLVTMGNNKLVELLKL